VAGAIVTYELPSLRPKRTSSRPRTFQRVRHVTNDSVLVGDPLLMAVELMKLTTSQGHRLPRGKAWRQYGFKTSGELYYARIAGPVVEHNLAAFPVYSPRGLGCGIGVFDLERWTWQRLFGEQETLSNVVIDAERTLLASAGQLGTVRLWSLKTNRPRWHTSMLTTKPLAMYGVGARDIPGPRRRKWQQAANHARLARVGPRGLLCLAGYDDRLELWDLAADRRVVSVSSRDVTGLLARDDDCVVSDAEGVWLVRRDKSRSSLKQSRQVGAVSRWNENIIFAIKKRLFVHRPDGVLVSEHPLPHRASVVFGAGSRLYLGTLAGLVYVGVGDTSAISGWRELPSSGTSFLPLSMAASPAISVGKAAKPGHLLAVGYVDGSVRIWDSTGAPLLHRRLHGPARYLTWNGSVLHAASERGDYERFDLAVLFEKRCRLMRRVWRDVPYGPVGGQVAFVPIPKDHPCR
jgi:hypothetical protein